MFTFVGPNETCTKKHTPQQLFGQQYQIDMTPLKVL
jgi:hypothetical protein